MGHLLWIDHGYKLGRVEVIQLLDEDDVSSSQFKYLLIEILKVKGQFQQCYYKHIIREANMLVDSFSMVYL